MGTVIVRSLVAAYEEWLEAPWFVLYVVAIVALLSQLAFDLVNLPF